MPSERQHKFKTLLLVLLVSRGLHAEHPCAACHAKEVAAYAQSGMARSLAAVGSAKSSPDGRFEHIFSHSEFIVHASDSGITQTVNRPDETIQKAISYVIGSGDHALGYLVMVGDSVFQSPLSYYTKRETWGVAPGYELDPHPDFSRPISAECLFCHAGKALPVANSLNRYQPGVFAQYGISCERCHGDAVEHLRRPMPGSILNPAKLKGAVRASICEQCHLAGEVRIPNPGTSITDFKPGKTLEDFYTTYVAAEASGQSIKVVSHAEQLALSLCARKSGEQLWCGTCHNPHDQPIQPAAYFRDRCLSCHGTTLNRAHAAPGRDCVACHMPQLPAKDGGHTAFTDHKIARPSGTTPVVREADTLTAWREPDGSLRDRNLGLALVASGLENQSSAEVIRGYRLLNRLGKEYATDPAVLTNIGSILMKGKQPAEALKRFRRVVEMAPGYAPYHVNLASALLATNQPVEAEQELQKALTVEPLLQSAVGLLAKIYRERGEIENAKTLSGNYNKQMGILIH